jgi:hypothetical protein
MIVIKTEFRLKKPMVILWFQRKKTILGWSLVSCTFNQINDCLRWLVHQTIHELRLP